MAPTVYSPPVSTYVPLGSITLASTATEISFSGFSSSYKDLILVGDFARSGSSNSGYTVCLRFNGDTGSNYSDVAAGGDGFNTSGYSNNYSGTFLRQGYFASDVTVGGFHTQIFDYSGTSKDKGILTRESRGARGLGPQMYAGRWISLDAITSITVFPNGDAFAAGGTFSLYGIGA